jgi:hypothetical protein
MTRGILSETIHFRGDVLRKWSFQGYLDRKEVESGYTYTLNQKEPLPDWDWIPEMVRIIHFRSEGLPR